MTAQIGASSRAGESILGPNLHSEQQEPKLMSFPSILHFGRLLAAVWRRTSSASTTMSEMTLISTAAAAAERDAASFISQTANDMLIG